MAQGPRYEATEKPHDMNCGTRRVSVDIDFCRSHFPATGNGWIYADNAGGSLVPRSVIRQLSTFDDEAEEDDVYFLGAREDSAQALESTQETLDLLSPAGAPPTSWGFRQTMTQRE